MEKITDLFKKIRDIKGTFHAVMGMIKKRNSKDLTEAEETKKTWQEYTKELYKKRLNDPDTHAGVVTHLEPDILECEVKWVLGSNIANKSNGGDGIPAELFQILKDYAIKMLMCQKSGKFSNGHRTGKGSFHSNPKEGQCQRMLKLPHNCAHFTC